MKTIDKVDRAIHVVDSIAEIHNFNSLPQPINPLISLINYDDIKNSNYINSNDSVVINFYIICMKKNFKGKMKYGQNYFDFNNGVLTFISPSQVISEINENNDPISGWSLMIHPDFIRNYALSKNIKSYGYFSYAVNEALHLSDKEEQVIEGIMKNIEQEYKISADSYSQDVIISYIELLLNYCNRFYNRQFLTHKNLTSDLLTQLEELLESYFESEKIREYGIPTVQYIADKLNVSPNYLSDILRALTGQSTQQHIHNKLIEKAKEKLSITSLSVSEIAFKLGFDYPQSFSKIFKAKTNFSPIEFRNSFK